jgi:hypothetical protein
MYDTRVSISTLGQLLDVLAGDAIAMSGASLTDLIQVEVEDLVASSYIQTPSLNLNGVERTSWPAGNAPGGSHYYLQYNNGAGGFAGDTATTDGSGNLTIASLHASGAGAFGGNLTAGAANSDLTIRTTTNGYGITLANGSSAAARFVPAGNDLYLQNTGGGSLYFSAFGGGDLTGTIYANAVGGLSCAGPGIFGGEVQANGANVLAQNAALGYITGGGSWSGYGFNFYNGTGSQFSLLFSPDGHAYFGDTVAGTAWFYVDGSALTTSSDLIASGSVTVGGGNLYSGGATSLTLNSGSGAIECNGALDCLFGLNLNSGPGGYSVTGLCAANLLVSDGFNGNGSYTSFVIVNGLITSAS